MHKKTRKKYNNRTRFTKYIYTNIFQRLLQDAKIADFTAVAHFTTNGEMQ